MRKLLLVIPLVLILVACNLGEITQTTPDVAAMVNATLTAIAQNPNAAPLDAASPAGGGIAGQMNYPAEAIPAMRVVAFLTGSGEYFSVDTAAGQNTYQIDNLPEGKYQVVAYTLGEGGFPAGLAGGHTQAVLCGMAETCTDHTLVDVIVFNGEITPDVNILDWLQPGFPPMPGATAIGSIAGPLAYPSSGIPPLKVVAFNLDTNATYSVDTVENQTSFQLDNLPVGRYHVVAYVTGGGIAGGYTAAVPCGLTAACTDHTLLEVVVVAGSVIPNISPFDFYAPEGAFPPMP